MKRTTILMLRDDSGCPTRAGDTVVFSYGIPPRTVRAKIVKRGNSLIALTPTEAVAECNLRSLRRYVGRWDRVETTQSNANFT